MMVAGGGLLSINGCSWKRGGRPRVEVVEVAGVKFSAVSTTELLSWPASLQV